MGFLTSASSGSVTRYQVQGQINTPLMETVAAGLKSNQIIEIDNTPMEKAVGWTSLENPYLPDFEGSSFVIGTNFVFSLRIDKKTLPSKIVNKLYHIEITKKLSEEGRDYLSRNEKKRIKERVKEVLNHRIPATPNVYDVLWDYENAHLLFFSTLKSANEELEEIFTKSFQLNLIRLFPFMIADLTMNLSDAEKDVLSKVSETTFRE